MSIFDMLASNYGGNSRKSSSSGTRSGDSERATTYQCRYCGKRMNVMTGYPPRGGACPQRGTSMGSRLGHDWVRV